MYWPGTIAVASGTTGPEAESATGVRPWVPPCTREPDLFFAESPADVETAKALCRGCAARLACLAGARERHVPGGARARRTSLPSQEPGAAARDQPDQQTRERW